MSILKLRKLKQIALTEEDSVEVIKYKYSKLLNIFGFRTGTESYGISFKRKIITITHSGENRVDAMKIFRDGNIYISAENNQLNVNWSVKLDSLYFLSSLISIVVGFMTSFFLNFQLFFSIITGLTVFVILNIIGILIINLKINEINNTCLGLSE